jgi:hypothetical protein
VFLAYQIFRKFWRIDDVIASKVWVFVRDERSHRPRSLSSRKNDLHRKFLQKQTNHEYKCEMLLVFLLMLLLLLLLFLFEEGRIILVSLATLIKLLTTLFCRQVWTVSSTISIVSLRGKGSTTSVRRLKKKK